ncbi:RsmB/NOP family class I SAM-dependent RNA methyltransferase [Neomicrococcus aestuarii]|uniref:Methyltransferase n=1 Tax=Neomicrococcus aestuarii TaxID=556325 RepID=A0A1L2ZKC3_9MICC|nr:transcription antitermination factor NusB [Neomicrococcus aestuarii]APF39804.1 methyltransferase [Neomicrococcus aestuarii]
MNYDGAARHSNSSRRDAAGRERNRGFGEKRQYSAAAPSQRKRSSDPARLTAFQVLRAVSGEDAYANLVLPRKIRENHLNKLDAGFATELTYGALREQGLYDAVLQTCVDRPLATLDAPVLDALRLGAHQLLSMRVPAHAALDEMVSLVRSQVGTGPSGLVNAVLRKVSLKSREEWVEQLTADISDDSQVMAITHSHPEWIVRAFRQSLVAHGRDVAELEELLEADNDAPVVNLVALPGIGDLGEVYELGGRKGKFVPGSAYYEAGDVGRINAVRAGTVRVQDAGSQAVARALAEVELPSGSSDSEWLDLCAGPGGKASLLAALAAQRDAFLTANEPQSHRADLVEDALNAVPQDAWQVTEMDGRDYGQGQTERLFDRIMVDAPCSGLGALRRRPEARWRKTLADVAELTTLQSELLDSALKAVRVGGVVAYVTCSPHPAETVAIVEDAIKRNPQLRVLDTAAALNSVILTAPVAPGHQYSSAAASASEWSGNSIQLWPHANKTDAMFMTLLTIDEPTTSED